MSVWYCIPSKRPPDESGPILREWKERGYTVAVWIDADSPVPAPCDAIIRGARYPGYAVAVNRLVKLALEDERCDWIVTGGDDVSPDLSHTAEEIAHQCSAYFGDMWSANLALTIKHSPISRSRAQTYGVMQPTGDRWGINPMSQVQWPNAPAYIDRVCGSPWMGREFCKRMYGGKGPLYEGYTHMYVDEELQHVAKKLGVLWQRRDLIHYHHHWGRKRGSKEDMPQFLEAVNSPEHWRQSKALFDERLAAGFPGHEPL